jgi:FtsP/CotA-like multicopper oxidase with cupredoxin domain
MQTTLRIGLVASAIVIGSAGGATAETVIVGANRDTTLYAENGALSNGIGQHLFTGLTDNEVERRGLLGFDVAGALPAGATITSVTLTLRLTRTKTQNLVTSLFALREAWGEGTSDAPQEEGAGTAATTGDATWTHRVYASTLWTTPGGYRVNTASATTIVGNNLVDYTWSGVQMVTDVQAWLDTPSSNHGWILIAPAAGRKETKRFASRQAIDAATRPRLSVTFTPPAPTGACCASDGSCTSVLDPGGTCTGTYQGSGTTCSPNSCPQPVGACCAANATASCSTVTQGDCLAGGGVFQGTGSLCAMTSCPVVLTPFVDPLPIPAPAQPTTGTVGGVASYQLAMVQFSRKMHRDLPATTMWGFDDGTGPASPGPTIEAQTGMPISVVWKNDLRDNGVLRTNHFLPVDQCLITGSAPRTVIHLHGGHVPPAADGHPHATFMPGEQAVYDYPNGQHAATLWYHDHAMGITRLNVQMGLAGFYLLRDSTEQALALPSGQNEIPLAIQDRTFHPNGQLNYPAEWMPHFFGDTVLVNGMVWPYLNVRRGKYRFRLLDGSGSRTFTLSLSNGATFHVIGTEGGLLPAPVAVTSLTLMPGERADVVIDFASYAPGTEIVLRNSASAPFPDAPGVGVVPNVMKFIVGAQGGYTTALPSSLVPVPPIDPTMAVMSRDLVLKKRADACTGEAWTIDGLGFHDITEKPVLGTTEIWRFVNSSGVAHPMHLHLVQFQVIDRQPFAMVNDVPMPTGAVVPRLAHEAGWKDTVNVGANEMVRVIAKFDGYTGTYPYHCHILEHEDWDMMRQFEVVAPPGSDAGVDAGAPDAGVDAGAPDAGVDGDAGPDLDGGVFDDADLGLDAGNGYNGGGGGCCDTRTSGSPLPGVVLVLLGLTRRRRRADRACAV